LCKILTQKLIKSDFGWESAPNPAGELTALPQTPFLDLRGLLIMEKGGGRFEREGIDLSSFKHPEYAINRIYIVTSAELLCAVNTFFGSNLYNRRG